MKTKRFKSLFVSVLALYFVFGTGSFIGWRGDGLTYGSNLIVVHPPILHRQPLHFNPVQQLLQYLEQLRARWQLGNQHRRRMERRRERQQQEQQEWQRLERQEGEERQLERQEEEEQRIRRLERQQHPQEEDLTFNEGYAPERHYTLGQGEHQEQQQEDLTFIENYTPRRRLALRQEEHQRYQRGDNDCELLLMAGVAIVTAVVGCAALFCLQ
ncbi:hypothetical protein FACS1894152_4690 [Bacilli bacterium]|nr:hypothetical protein FACS1894152_4690 [Bacilli bacterium]